MRRHQKAIKAGSVVHFVSAVYKDFQVWDLLVNADQTAMLTCGDGNGREVYSKPVPFTDFPEPGIRFYYVC